MSVFECLEPVTDAYAMAAFIEGDPLKWPDEDVLEEIFADKEGLQETAELRVRQHLIRALRAAYALDWRQGTGSPVENARAALEELIRERFTPPPPVYRKQRIPPALRLLVLERDAYRCRICLTWYDLTVDHIYPESLGGPTEPDNLQALCRPCNSRKGVRVG